MGPAQQGSDQCAQRYEVGGIDHRYEPDRHGPQLPRLGGLPWIRNEEGDTERPFEGREQPPWSKVVGQVSGSTTCRPIAARIDIDAGHRGSRGAGNPHSTWSIREAPSPGGVEGPRKGG